ncbi:MAG TPA: hypothetical protein VF322_00865 [Gammaproteobacteria bacterium]
MSSRERRRWVIDRVVKARQKRSARNGPAGNGKHAGPSASAGGKKPKDKPRK